LLQALVDSGVDWNDFSKVSAISAKQWTEIVQLSPNNPMYLGEERGERLVKMADYLLSQGIPTMTDLLDSIDYDAINLVEFLQEINYYSTLRAQELYTAGQHASFFQIVFHPLIKFKYLYFKTVPTSLPIRFVELCLAMFMVLSMYSELKLMSLSSKM